MYRPKYPLHVVIILDHRCNLTCTHCSSNAGPGHGGGFDTARARDLIDQLADVGVLDVALSGGEPLLRKDLESLIAHARARGLAVGTSTNGFALTHRRARHLAVAGLSRLQVSIDGPEDIHDRIRGPGAFQAAARAVVQARDAGLRTHVCFTAMASNQAYLDETIDIAARLGARGFNLSQYIATGRGTAREDLSAAQARQVLETWIAARRRHPAMHFTAHSAGLSDLGEEWRDAGCQAGISIACVTARGDVTPCVMMPLSLGRLDRRGFREIWENAPLLRKLRARAVDGACRACVHRRGCGGCRAASLAATGDPLGGDPRCWRAAG